MSDHLLRAKPLRSCPELACGRGAGHCRKRGGQGTCLKTHFASHDQFLRAVTQKLYAQFPHLRNAQEGAAAPQENGEAMARMHRALKARLAFLEGQGIKMFPKCS